MDPNLIASILSTLTLAVGVITLWKDHQRRRRQATLDAYIQAGQYRHELATAVKEQLSNEEMIDILDGPGSLDEALMLAVGESPQRWAIREYLNYWEHIAVGTKRGVYDRTTLRLLSRGRIIKTFEGYAPYIYMIRQQIDQQDVYSELEKLATGFGAFGGREMPVQQYEAFLRDRQAG
jgi:hypothetical protein